MSSFAFCWHDSVYGRVKCGFFCCECAVADRDRVVSELCFPCLCSLLPLLFLVVLSRLQDLLVIVSLRKRATETCTLLERIAGSLVYTVKEMGMWLTETEALRRVMQNRLTQMFQKAQECGTAGGSLAAGI